MPSYISKPRKLRDAIVQVLTAIQYNGQAAFALATADPAAEFDQEPYALVFPGGVASQRGTTAEQDRTVNFEILLLLNLETNDSNRTQLATYDYMYDLTELVMSTLEVGDFNDVLNTTDNSLGVQFMDVTRGSFIPADTKAGTALLCTVNVAIRYSIGL